MPKFYRSMPAPMRCKLSPSLGTCSAAYKPRSLHPCERFPIALGARGNRPHPIPPPRTTRLPPSSQPAPQHQPLCRNPRALKSAANSAKMNVCCDDDWCPDSLLILFSTAATWAEEYSNNHETTSSFGKKLIAALCSRCAMIHMFFGYPD